LGWQYRDWRGPFYPTGLPQREWLACYATRFSTVEINLAFYRLHGREQFERWAGYARFHGGRAGSGGYGAAALRSAVGRLRATVGQQGDLFAYFNNDRLACAPRDAASFARLWGGPSP
jgi:uncharacterized protein YecE (DUF72 family)